VNLNFGKTNPRVSSWFASQFVILAFYLCFRFDLLGYAFYVYRDLLELLEVIYRGITPSLICARAQGGK